MRWRISSLSFISLCLIILLSFNRSALFIDSLAFTDNKPNIRTNTDPIFVDAYVEANINVFTTYFDVDFPGLSGGNATIQITLYDSSGNWISQDQHDYYFNTNDSMYNSITMDQNLNKIYSVVLDLLHNGTQVDQWMSDSFRLYMPILQYAYPFISGNEVSFPFNIDLENGQSGELEVRLEIYNTNKQLVSNITGNFTFSGFDDEGYNLTAGQLTDGQYFPTMKIYYHGFLASTNSLLDFYVDQNLSIQSVDSNISGEKVSATVSIYSGGVDTKISLIADLINPNGGIVKHANYDYTLKNGVNTFEIPFGVVQPGTYHFNIQISMNYDAYYLYFNSPNFVVLAESTSASTTPSLPIPVSTSSILISLLSVMVCSFFVKKSKR